MNYDEIMNLWDYTEAKTKAPIALDFRVKKLVNDITGLDNSSTYPVNLSTFKRAQTLADGYKDLLAKYTKPVELVEYIFSLMTGIESVVPCAIICALEEAKSMQKNNIPLAFYLSTVLEKIPSKYIGPYALFTKVYSFGDIVKEYLGTEVYMPSQFVRVVPTEVENVSAVYVVGKRSVAVMPTKVALRFNSCTNDIVYDPAIGLTIEGITIRLLKDITVVPIDDYVLI